MLSMFTTPGIGPVPPTPIGSPPEQDTYLVKFRAWRTMSPNEKPVDSGILRVKLGPSRQYRVDLRAHALNVADNWLRAHHPNYARAINWSLHFIEEV